MKQHGDCLDVDDFCENQVDELFELAQSTVTRVLLRERNVEPASAIAIKRESESDSESESDPELNIHPEITALLGRHGSKRIADGTLQKRASRCDLRADDEVVLKLTFSSPLAAYMVKRVNEERQMIVFVDPFQGIFSPRNEFSTTFEWLDQEMSCVLWWWDYTVEPYNVSTASDELKDDLIQFPVAIQECEHGHGVFATDPVNKGTLLPYGGVPMSRPRAKGQYTVCIDEYLYISAEEASTRRIGAYCNDSTVRIIPQDGVEKCHPTGQDANCKLVLHFPDQEYLDNWNRGRNDGSKMTQYVQVLHNIDKNEELTVDYGKRYWGQDTTSGINVTSAIDVF